MPISKRAVVPELAQSIGASGCFGPFSPHPVMPPARDPSIWRSIETSAPRAFTAAIEARTSAESSTPVRREVPCAIAENKTARCEIDLSPGTVVAPSSAPPRGLIREVLALSMISLL